MDPLVKMIRIDTVINANAERKAKEKNFLPQLLMVVVLVAAAGVVLFASEHHYSITDREEITSLYRANQ